MIVDVWAQAPTERMASQPWLASLLRWTGQDEDAVQPGVTGTMRRWTRWASI